MFSESYSWCTRYNTYTFVVVLLGHGSDHPAATYVFRQVLIYGREVLQGGASQKLGASPIATRVTGQLAIPQLTVWSLSLSSKRVCYS